MHPLIWIYCEDPAKFGNDSNVATVWITVNAFNWKYWFMLTFWIRGKCGILKIHLLEDPHDSNYAYISQQKQQ